MVDDISTDRSVGSAAREALEKSRTEMTAAKLKKVDGKTTELLGDVRAALANISDLKRAHQWLEGINKLQSQAQLPRFVIGVLGDTGSGKSSLINAVLDEEKVVPTSCMRACTAVITEISWNASEDKKYRAEIQFITQAEWSGEVMALHRDILDNGKLSTDIRSPDSDAGNAYTILKAVYPKHTDKEFVDVDWTVLANHAKVRDVIGTTVVVEEDDCKTFFGKIQSYVDSEDKRARNVAEHPEKDGKRKNEAVQERATKMDEAKKNVRKEPEMAFWPLIKVVRVFLKSEVLSTGVVLVDLPGGRDSNAARAAVAAKYVKECSRLWVVAPITRAVDDKTARDLMGDHFKQQLKLDGSYSNITFICTKTDELSIQDAASSLGLEDYIHQEQKKRAAMKTEIDAKRCNLKTLETERRIIQEQVKNIAIDLETWGNFQRQVTLGATAYAPVESPRKRKRQTSLPTNNDAKSKKMRTGFLSETEDESSDDSDSDADDAANAQPTAEPLTAEEIGSKIEELKASKKSTRDQKKNITQQISQLKEDIKGLCNQRSTIKTGMHSVCIQGRNFYSREAIKEDFAFGWREYDENLLAEQSHSQASQGPESQPDDVDYERIRDDLPVFCASSRGYQQLRGRMKQDNRVVGFVSPEDTEIPGLRAHTLKLAATVQAGVLKHHLSEICRLLGAMDLFIAGDVAAAKLSNKEKTDECDLLEKSLAKLGKALGETISSSMEETKALVRNDVLRRIRVGASNACNKALETAKTWSMQPNKEDPPSGGLRFTTYRATCRRGGVFKGSAGMRDFNEDLLKPMKKHSAQSWDQAFNRRLPEKLKALASSCKQMIDAFHERMKNQRFLLDNANLVQDILAKHISAQGENLAHISQEHVKLLKDKQRDANRLFYPSVQGGMQPIYLHCSHQRGNGAFNAVKEMMDSRLSQARQTMFQDGANIVTNAVDELLKVLERMIRDDINATITAMEEEYTDLIGAVTSEADDRARKVLSPVLRDFYQKTLLALAEIEQEAAPSVVDIEDIAEVDEDSSYHESD